MRTTQVILTLFHATLKLRGVASLRQTEALASIISFVFVVFPFERGTLNTARYFLSHFFFLPTALNGYYCS